MTKINTWRDFIKRSHEVFAPYAGENSQHKTVVAVMVLSIQEQVLDRNLSLEQASKIINNEEVIKSFYMATQNSIAKHLTAATEAEIEVQAKAAADRLAKSEANTLYEISKTVTRIETATEDLKTASASIKANTGTWQGFKIGVAAGVAVAFFPGALVNIGSSYWYERHLSTAKTGPPKPQLPIIVNVEPIILGFDALDPKSGQSMVDLLQQGKTVALPNMKDGSFIYLQLPQPKQPHSAHHHARHHPRHAAALH